MNKKKKLTFKQRMQNASKKIQNVSKKIAEAQEKAREKELNRLQYQAKKTKLEADIARNQERKNKHKPKKKEGLNIFDDDFFN